MREPVVRFVEVDGLSLAIHEWAGEGAPMVLVHASGYCARVWDPVVALLPSTARVLALDVRGHGLSDCPEPIEERVDWRIFGTDLAAVLDALDLEDATLVGHSMGGHMATAAAIEAPSRVSRLVLLDPTLTAPPNEGEPLRPPASEQPARKRRNEWASPEAFYDALREKPNFATWDEDALRGYTTHGLRRAGEGYVLACPPLFEASIYAGNQSGCLDDDLPSIDAEVFVLRARPRRPEDPPGLGPSATRPEALALFQHLTDRQHPEATHFFPLEQPSLAAGAIIEALATD